MNEYIITYMLEDASINAITVSAVNKFMAWEVFEQLTKDFEQKVIAADCNRSL